MFETFEIKFLGFSREILFNYLAIYKNEPPDLIGLQYLQAARLGFTAGILSDEYDKLRHSLSSRLMEEILALGFDCAISPPSRFPFAREYTHNLVEAMNISMDLSESICKHSQSVLATGGAIGFQDLLNSWEIIDEFPLRDEAKVLLVDDIVTTGTTLTALVYLLSDGGKRKISFHAIAPLLIR